MLYIGLNGYIGSGKDTVAKMLKVILNNEWKSKEDAKKYYEEYFKSHRYATTTDTISDDFHCTCIAFADQLKKICSLIFGIPIDRFYYNKSNSWVCVNKDFEYTEVMPNEDHIITAEDFYTGIDKFSNSQEKYWMSLRDILVYVGTYVCQQDINREIFVNIVNNDITDRVKKNHSLKYIICTDVRFEHEYNYIRKHSGVMINITRDSVEQVDNVAEHDLDGFDSDNFDYCIYNNDGYDDLFDTVWDMVHENLEFADDTIEVCNRSSYNNNYLRLISADTTSKVYKLCTNSGLVGISYDSYGDIFYIDPTGGPLIRVGESIPGTNLRPTKIEFNEWTDTYYIYV